MPLERPPSIRADFPAPELAAAQGLQIFQGAGFSSPAEAWREWQSLGEKAAPDSPFRQYLAESWSTLCRSADPDLGLRQWSRWLELLPALDGGGGPPGGGQSSQERAAARWKQSPLFRESFLLLLAVSPALGEELLREWESFTPERWLTGWETPQTMRRRLQALLPPESDEKLAQQEFLKALRWFQKLEEIRIAFLDEYLRLPVDQITRQISWLADGIIQRCLDRAIDETGRRFQIKAPGTGLVVFGLGKLGGLELNYSSDIDVIFLRADETPTGAETPPAGQAPANPEVFCTKVAEKVVALITEYSEDRPLYRVDIRLRPEGSRGQLVWPVRMALEYYHSQGRTWERQALIRLRPVAGDLSLGRRFKEELDAFIFRASLSEEAIDDLHRLKAQIESLAEMHGESADHVKIGHGGIRDVEFIVQYFQLLYGAGFESLKNPNLFEVFKTLERLNLLNPEETDSLSRGYRFLRQVEHRIQLNHRLQTHRIPENPADLRRIARGLGFETVEAFQEKLASVRARIRAVYRRLFESAATQETEEARLTSLLELPLELVEEQGRRLLEMHGFKSPGESFARLRAISGEGTAAWDQFHAAEAFRRLAPRLLREIIQYPDPDRALSSFSECVSTLGARSVFFDLLNESEEALKQMVAVSAHSKYVVEILRSYPGIFDEVIDAMRTGYRIHRQELREEIERYLAMEEQAGKREHPVLFEQKYLRILVAAFHDLERQENLMTTMYHITQVAEAILHGVMIVVEKELRGKLGALPEAAGAARPAFLVLGLGKLGGEEMNYRSDLDLVFLYRGAGATSKGFSLQEYYTRLAQEIFGRLNETDALGPLWKADVRLRPMGSKSLMAVEFGEWQRYFRDRVAQTWERQAFLRARPVAGDADLGQEAMEFLHQTLPLHQGENAARLREEILDMRRRLEKSVPPEDLKRGRGGIVDVEFLAQALQLLHGRNYPEVLVPNTASALMLLLHAGILESQMGSELLSAYQFLRWLETRLSLLLAPEESIGSLGQERLRSLIQKIGYRTSGEEAPEQIFLEELRYHRERNRQHLLKVLGAE
ncbi:MAG: bifunctional [glutamate--ammonia ligase]-adenylyl-L-tyrosine phosphorylase/[glutamate--ammonia-ligase] adenylyltransferase [Planctomycetes bacterium]|nr:bifunctional [glutamate--ammonia ligase]-adenylyl-L-tyrosine phosphorylase/[glutamate--ammonia-ligase] adenylyltransferase [Planctomycetota bacterium]